MKSTVVTWVGALSRGRLFRFYFSILVDERRKLFYFCQKMSKIMLKDTGDNKDKIIASYKWYLD